MAFTIDPVAAMTDGFGFVVRDDKSKKLIVSICYATKEDAEEAASAMKSVLSKAVTVEPSR